MFCSHLGKILPTFLWNTRSQSKNLVQNPTEKSHEKGVDGMNGMLPYHATKVRGTPAAIQTLLDYLAWKPTTTTFGAGYISDPGWTKPLPQGGERWSS